jgi:hypothetical protein
MQQGQGVPHALQQPSASSHTGGYGGVMIGEKATSQEVQALYAHHTDLALREGQTIK